MTRERASVAAAVFGGVVGLGVGFAYLGGAVAQSATVRGQAHRLVGAHDLGFTEEALSAVLGGLDHSALTVARRHDPYTVAGDAQRDRQAAQLTALLQERRPENAAGLVRTGADGLRGPVHVDPARPFNLGGALEESRDLDCLTQAVYYESRGEGQAGMQAVAQVILNRARHGAFPNTVCGVVFQGAGRRTGCQFSFVCDGSMRARREGAAWERSRRIAARALSGYVHAPVGNATHFHTTAVSPRWSRSLVRVTQVGSHIFYRFGGRRGAASQFAYTPQPSSAAEARAAEVRPIQATVIARDDLQPVTETISPATPAAQERPAHTGEGEALRLSEAATTAATPAA